MSDEYIKKEDAVNLFEALADSLDTFEFRMAAIGAANELRKMPSMCFAPVRHGRWVESFKVNAPTTLRSRWTCSWCGNVQTYGATDYCPNCGARMDGDDNEID